MKNVSLVVTGMVCEGCEKRLVNALSLIDGISDVKASHIDNIVLFNMNDKVLLEDVKDTISNLGFEVE